VGFGMGLVGAFFEVQEICTRVLADEIASYKCSLVEHDYYWLLVALIRFLVLSRIIKGSARGDPDLPKPGTGMEVLGCPTRR